MVYLDSIEMVLDQDGSGTEEFHVAGFVQETFGPSSPLSGEQQKFGPFYVAIDPNGPLRRGLAQTLPFYLSPPGTPEWPRIFTVVISVLEEDDGGTVSDWQSNLWTVAQSAASGEIGQALRDLIEEEFKDYVSDNIGALIRRAASLPRPS